MKPPEFVKSLSAAGILSMLAPAYLSAKVRYLGFSAHSEVAAHAALDRYDFDSVLFPLSFPVWTKEGVGPSVHKRAEKDNRGFLAMKAMAHQKWPEGTIGVPTTDTKSYPSVLGAVLLGTGLALRIEFYRKPSQSPGLGLNGTLVGP